MLEKTGEFDGMTFWQKDEMIEDKNREASRAFGDDFVRYLAAQKTLHSD